MVSGRFWELLGTPGVDSRCLGMVLPASGATIPAHRTAGRSTWLLLRHKGSLILEFTHSGASPGASGGPWKLLKEFGSTWSRFYRCLEMVLPASGATVPAHRTAGQSTWLLLRYKGSLILEFTHSGASRGASGGPWKLLKAFGTTWSRF